MKRIKIGSLFVPTTYSMTFDQSFCVPIFSGPEVMPPTIDKDLFVELLTSSIIIAIVGYCVTLSMAKIYASKFAYKVDGNQELLSEVIKVNHRIGKEDPI